MAKITVKKESNYTVIDNSIFNNKNLSLKARGLLGTMLSLPEEWDYSVEGLCAILKEGQTSIKSALKELEAEGYLVRVQTRAENGCLGKMEYFVYEILQNKEVQPSVENQLADKQPVENSRQLNKQELNKQEIKKYSAAEPHHEQHQCVDDVLRKAWYIAKDKGVESKDCDTLVDTIKYYFDKYYSVFGKPHKQISERSLETIVSNLIGADGDLDYLLLENSYIDMIDRHFATKYGQKCDYSLQHFAAVGIIEYQARNCGFLDGYKE